MKIDVENLLKDRDVSIFQLPNGLWRVNVKSGDWDGSWWEYKNKDRQKAINMAVSDNSQLHKYIIKES